MPLNNPVPPNILQYVNTFMSPFSDVSVPPKPNILTEDRPENRILDNLGGLAIQKPHVAPSKIMPDIDILQSKQPARTGGDNQLTLDDLQFLDSLLSDSSSIALFNTVGSPQCINQPPMTGSAPPASTVCLADRPQRAMGPPCDNIGIDDAQFIPKIIEKASSRQPCSPFVDILPMQSAASKDSFDYDNYPAMLDECAKDLGSIISARDLYKLLADIFVAPRSVYLVEYMEVMWYLLTHNALPPLCIHTLISGNLRCAVISEEHVLNLPPELEEVCYARAIKEIDQLRGSSSPIFAIATIFLAIYDFQSGRYPEMIEHIELAHAVMFRCKIKGYGYPWRNVPDGVAQSPVYNFCVTTFWHTYSLRNLFSMLLTSKNRIDYGSLPVYSLNDCFLEGSNMEVGIDMADLLPEDFRSTNPMAPASLVFRADTDKDFMASRPPNSPTAHLEVCILPYLQSLTTHYHDHLHHYSLLASGKISLKQYHSKYTLPHSVQLTQEKVIEYLQMIKSRIDSLSAYADMYDLPNTSSLDQLELARMNECFLSARTQALDSTNVLANLLQIAYVCKFNLYCLGPTAIFAIEELMIRNIFEILRTLRYWSPALNLFVAGVQALSDQDCCINIPRNKEQFYDDLGYPDISATYEESRKSDQPSPAKRRRSDSLAATKAADETADGDETVSYGSVAEKIPEFPNPYPSNHIISIIIKELNISLAEFLAPAYPVLLLKLLNTPKSE
ncbi:hypothetical protein DL89DRAFT_321639 [Linderina pennispora]|uniref:Transcription factor domain-containing protein n=1 Tax=Linderina pennispora TaxID=61395 RepID=A0A1Y1WCJ8_9FUNG|nr:uncharacterized protein DL89DRAFT_321639 [Linderina pennispora]ORX71261.1 hypothetical protein DL89DRAFT_321639 [Linderina pennispora]